MENRALLLSSLLGVLFVVLLLYLDKYEREPLLKIGLLFAASILVTGLYGGIGARIAGGGEKWTLGLLCVRAPILEEGVKFGLFLFVFLIWRRWIDEPFDLIVYMGIIALGFAVQENIGYYMMCTRNALVSGWLTGDYSLYDRALATIAARRAVPGHLMMDTVGISLLARGLGKRSFPFWFLGAYLTAAAIHAGWNLFASGGGTPFLIYVLLLAIGTLRIVRRMRRGSHYWRTQWEWRNAVAGAIASLERSGVAAGSIPADLRPLKESALGSLRLILRGLQKLTVHPGTDQARIFRTLEENSPLVPPAFDSPSLQQLQGRLAALIRALGSYRNPFLHWTYWMGLLAIFVSVGFAATFLSLILERAIVRF